MCRCEGCETPNNQCTRIECLVHYQSEPND